MNKIFLATSFSGKVNYDTKQVLPEFRKEIEQLLKHLRELPNAEIFCAVENEEWVIKDLPPEIGVNIDLQKIDESETFLALVHEEPSAGVQFEIGYAVSKGKTVFVASPKDVKLSYFNQGAVNAGKMKHISFESWEDVADRIAEEIN